MSFPGLASHQKVRLPVRGSPLMNWNHLRIPGVSAGCDLAHPRTAGITAGAGYGLALPAWPGFELGWLAWFALVPMLRNPRTPASLQACWWFAFVGSLTGGWWVLGYHPLLGTLALAWHTLLLLLPWLGYRALTLRLGVRAARWLLPALWVLCEWTEARVQPFFWGTFGSTQAGLLPVAQAADLFGVWGLSFWVVSVNVLLVQCLEARDRLRWAAVLALGFGAPWIYGLWALQGGGFGSASQKTLQVVLIASGVSKASGLPDAASAMERVREAQRLEADLAVLPESLFPHAPFWSAEFRGAENWRMPLLLPYPWEQGRRQASSVLLWTPQLQQRLAGGDLEPLYAAPHYHKRALIPWTERRLVPDAWATWLYREHGIWLSNLSPGTGPLPLRLERRSGGSVSLGPLLCYEVAFPERAADQVRAGAEVLVLMSNEISYGPTLHWQSLMMARLRAIETRRPLLRANTIGAVAVIDAEGRFEQVGDARETPLLRASVHAREGRSLYVRYPDALPQASLILLLAVAALPTCGRFLRRNRGLRFFKTGRHCS